MSAASEQKVAAGVMAVGRMALVGVGTGGCRAVAAMSEGWDDGPSMYAVDTDSRALIAAGGVANHLAIGATLTRGMSAGGDMQVGRLAVEEASESLRGIFAGMELVFLVTTLGGGTGSGAAPTVARLAREAGAMVLAVATLPFPFEGAATMAQARKALGDLRDEADVVAVVPNERLFESQRSATIEDAYRASDQMLGLGVYAIWKLLTRRSYLNDIDASVLRNVVRAVGGTCVFGVGEAQGGDKAGDAVRRALASPLFGGGLALGEAAAAVVAVVGGPDLTFLEVERAMETVHNAMRKDARLFSGTVVDDNWRGACAVTILAAEIWTEEDVADIKGAAAAGKDAPATAPGPRRKRQGGQAQQHVLSFEATGKGIFKDVEPTNLDGQDMDLPTYLRKGMVIEK